MALSQWNSKLEPCHFASDERVLCYLKGIKNLRLRYGSTVTLLSNFQGFTDSNWGGESGDPSTCASVSGYCWFFAGGLISWSAKKQVCIMLSTMEKLKTVFNIDETKGFKSKAVFIELLRF
jgi:hypothetical protein